MFNNQMMLAIKLIGFVIFVYVGWKRRDPFLYLACAVSLLYQAVYYSSLILDPHGLALSIEGRMAFFRPGEAAFLTGIVLSLLNGRIIKFFRRMMRR